MRIKNWKKFQHFKNRKPPWIKLYRDILDDIKWHELDAKAAKVLVMLWLIASEDEGNIPDIKSLAFRLRISEKDTKDSISKLSHWLGQDDINAISEGYQCDPLETETETEIEKELEKEKETKNAAAVVVPDWIPLETWNQFLEMRRRIKKPPTEYAVQLLIDKLLKFKESGQNIQAVLEKSITSSWQDVFEITEKQNPFSKQDVIHVTVPAPPNQDAALRKIEQDYKKAVPVPDSIRELAKKMKMGD